MPKRQRTGAAGLALAAALAFAWLPASAGTAPVTLDLKFEPPSGRAWPEGTAQDAGAAPGSCHVAIGQVSDVRADPHALGALGAEVFETSGTAQWLRSGLEDLSRDPRIKIVVAPEPGDAGVVLNADLLKAYVINVTSETRSVNVVARIRFGDAGSPNDTRIYRGTDEAVTWIDDSGETETSFNTALAKLLQAVDQDIVARCADSVPASGGGVRN